MKNILSFAEAVEIADKFDYLLSEVIREYAELSGEHLGMCGQIGHTSLPGIEAHIRQRETQIAEYREKIFRLKNSAAVQQTASVNIRKIAARNGVVI